MIAKLLHCYIAIRIKNNSTIQQFNNYFSNKGFTFVEILVVVTIIGLLSAAGIGGFQSVTKSGRDALRKSELEQLRSALEVYKSENGRYPASSACLPVDTPGFMPVYLTKFPEDPRKSLYSYCYSRQTSNTYNLCAHIENSGDTSTFCPGPSPCNTVNSDNRCNYQVVNP